MVFRDNGLSRPLIMVFHWNSFNVEPSFSTISNCLSLLQTNSGVLGFGLYRNGWSHSVLHYWMANPAKVSHISKMAS